MKKPLLFGLIAIMYTCGSANAQTVISAELQEEFSTSLLQLVFPFINIDYAVNTYRVTYTGQDALGQPDTLSGLLAIPQTTNNPRFPLAIYHHATIFINEDAPSVMGAQERQLVSAFTTNGYITMAPDYLGYGVDVDELHPYLHRASEAQAGKDMLIAVRAWLTEQGIAYNDQIFTTGYSQGGHSSAAFQQLLETENDPDLEITAASHLSGPYVISAGDQNLINNTSLPPTPAYLVFRYLGYNLAYQWYDNHAALFNETYLTPIDSFAQNQIDLEGLNNSLVSLMFNNGAGISDLFQDSILNILATNDSSHPVVRDVADNDVYAWAPQAPTRLVYCTEDQTVPFPTAIFTDSIMNFLGAPDVATANAGAQNHLDCVLPAALFTLSFFDQFANIISNTQDVSAAEPTWQVAPNPLGEGESLRLSTIADGPTHFTLFNLQGQKMAAGAILNSQQIPLPDLVRGSYILRLQLANRVAVRKLIVQ